MSFESWWRVLQTMSTKTSSLPKWPLVTGAEVLLFKTSSLILVFFSPKKHHTGFSERGAGERKSRSRNGGPDGAPEGRLQCRPSVCAVGIRQEELPGGARGGRCRRRERTERATACSGLEPLRGQFWSRSEREWKDGLLKWVWESRPVGCSVRRGPARLPAQQVRAVAEATDLDGYLGVPGRVQERGFTGPPCMCLTSVGMWCSRGYPKLLACLHRCSSTAGTIGSFLRA